MPTTTTVQPQEKSLADVDYGQAAKAGATSGIGAMLGELDDAFGSKKQLSATNRKKASQATGLIDDAADMTPRPRANALLDAEVTPSHGAVRDTADGLADVRVSTGNVGKKSNTALSKSKIKSASAKKSNPSLSKNQKKMQSQTAGSTLSENLIQKNNKHSLSNVEARKWYLAQEKKIPDMIDKNLSLKKQAKQAFKLRNQFRTQARELMADRELAKSLYKTDPNQTWRKIVQKQVKKGYVGDDIYKEIIASSQRSRGTVNRALGLEGKK